MSNAYQQGFIAKCAQHGVNPDQLLKAANLFEKEDSDMPELAAGLGGYAASRVASHSIDPVHQFLERGKGSLALKPTREMETAIANYNKVIRDQVKKVGPNDGGFVDSVKSHLATLHPSRKAAILAEILGSGIVGTAASHAIAD